MTKKDDGKGDLLTTALVIFGGYFVYTMGRKGQLGEFQDTFDKFFGRPPDGELPDGELPDGELPDGELPPVIDQFDDLYAVYNNVPAPKNFWEALQWKPIPIRVGYAVRIVLQFKHKGPGGWVNCGVDLIDHDSAVWLYTFGSGINVEADADWRMYQVVMEDVWPSTVDAPSWISFRLIDTKKYVGMSGGVAFTDMDKKVFGVMPSWMPL